MIEADKKNTTYPTKSCTQKPSLLKQYMEFEAGGEKKSNSILKKLERYMSSTDKLTKPSTKTPKNNTFTKSRSWHLSSTARGDSSNSKKAKSKGCFSVYVGPEKQRFVIKAEFANHPLFKMLLEDAELEYGFTRGGPLLIPCDVDGFYKVLADMDGGDDQFDANACASGCSSPFMARTRSSFDYGFSQK